MQFENDEVEYIFVKQYLKQGTVLISVKGRYALQENKPPDIHFNLTAFLFLQTPACLNDLDVNFARHFAEIERLLHCKAKLIARFYIPID